MLQEKLDAVYCRLLSVSFWLSTACASPASHRMDYSGGKQLSAAGPDKGTETLTVFEEYEGVLFDGTDDQFVVRSEHELHLLQHAITTSRFKMAASTKAVASSSDIADTIKSMKTSGPVSLDLARHMLVAVSGAAHIHSVLLRTDGSMPVVVVKWQYNKKAAHDRSYHAVKVPTQSGTVLFEHYRPRRTSLKDQPDISAPWRQEADFAAGRVLPGGGGGNTTQAPQRHVEQRPSEYNFFEQRPLDTTPPSSHFLQAGLGSGSETPKAAGGPASQAVAQAATQQQGFEPFPAGQSPRLEQRPSDDFHALQQRGRVGSMPPLEEHQQQARSRAMRK